MNPEQKELEDFIYLVSHEFNAPLRHIKQFSTLLVKRLQDKVSEEEKEYLNYIDISVTQAEEMLSALMRLSRLNTRPEDNASVNFNELIESVLESFDEETYEIETSELPESLVVQPSRIQHLFTNLIDNCIKFRKPDSKAAIKISAAQDQDIWTFTIEDNGLGIPEREHENVFKMFMRGDIRPQDNIDGVGAGLTISKKIVAQHGGKIWLKSEKDEGTKTYFTLRDQLL